MGQRHYLGSFAVWAVATAALFSCAPEEEKSHPEILAEVNGKIVGLSREEADSVCKDHFCEKNQIYTASFGRRRRPEPPAVEPPAPPKPAPTPTATPTPTPTQGVETLDYSRRVLRMPEAWAITEGSPEVVVAVVDSGVSYNHPDLAGNILSPGYDFYHNRDGAMDDNGHGTHCAGITGALKNGFGVRGISPKVKILPLKFLGSNGSGDTADAVGAIDYAVAHGAKVISNSWGGGGYSALLDQAIQRAVQAGVLVVAAAGNDNNNNDVTPSYPANYANVIAVGSTDSNDNRSSFSSYGRNSVMVMAPGSNIFSTYLNGGYATLSGTSMATPQVSGALALALSLKRDVSASEMKDMLCSTSEPILKSYSRCGRMDVGALVEEVSKAK